MQKTFFEEDYTKGILCKSIKQKSKLSMGEKIKQFEKKISKFHDLKFSTVVNSGSSANLILIQSLLNLGYLKRGDKVGFSAVTWSTNFMPILQLGLNPIPIDIDLENLNMCENSLKKTIKLKKIKLLFLTNAMGFIGKINKILDICENNKIILIEDNCESLGSEANNKKLGTFGIASTNSFFVGHHISTIEGGSINTSNEELNNMFKIVRAHGWDRDTKLNLKKVNFLKKFYHKYTFYDLAYNLRATEIAGIIGCVQMKFLNKIIKIRENNFKKIYRFYETNSLVEKLDLRHMNVISNFAFPIICKNQKILKKFVKNFIKNNIEIRPLIAGNITLQPVFKKYIKTKYNLPNSTKVHKSAFYIPNHPDLSEKDINRMINIIK